MARWIVSHFPRHLRYVEPYFGGGSVLLARDPADRRLWWPGRASDGREPDGVSELANDLNSDLVNFYQILHDPKLFEKLRRRLELLPLHEGQWRQARDALRAGRVADPVERAALFFALNRQSRQGLMKDFVTPVASRLRGGRDEQVNAWWSAVEGLTDVHVRLRDVFFTSRPALEVIRSQDADSTFNYLDPPYYGETRTARDAYGAFEMSDRDHEELLGTLAGLKGMFALSGYRNALYDDYARRHGWRRVDREFTLDSSGKGSKERKVESLWMNYPPRDADAS
jgi:DNA adenine methylase